MEWKYLFFAIGNIIGFLLYAGFIAYVVWLLFHFKKKLDIYMKMTLSLLGVSHLLLALFSIDNIVEDGNTFSTIGTVNLYENVQQTIEKIGILIDVARLNLLIAFVEGESERKKNWIIFYLVFFSVLFVGLCIILEFSIYQSVTNPSPENLNFTAIINMIYSYV